MAYKLDNIEITDTQLDELIAQREANKYPLLKRWKEDGEIVRFTTLKKGTVVVQGHNSYSKAGQTTFFVSHLDDRWEDVPYNKERDLSHTQAVECWYGFDTHYRAVKFYDAINDCTFMFNGNLNGSVYDNYKAVPLDKVPDWMNEARETLER